MEEHRAAQAHAAQDIRQRVLTHLTATTEFRSSRPDGQSTPWIAHGQQLVRAWARRAFEDAAPHATGSGYVNFLIEDEAERVAASYGANYPRLQAVKQRFDPGNLFRMNLNIAPAAAPQLQALP